MRATMMGLAAIAPLLAMTATPLPARAESCDDLWYARNEIYKAQGYCFRTRRGIDAFGNAGCQYDNADEVPLSAAQRRTIADIQREERARRCPR
jgi:hypothetical protein